MAGSHVPKQCRSCGSFCGGGHGNKFCQNTAHINQEPALAALSAWKRYHKNAWPAQVEDAKKRIANLLGDKS